MTITSPNPVSTLSLTDLREATDDYLRHSVTSTVTNVTRNLEDGDEGSFDVTVVNATADTGVRLENVVLHIQSSDDGVVALIPPGSALLIPRATNSSSAPRLSTSARVAEYFLFFQEGDITPNTVLDPGESIGLDLGFEATGAGSAQVTCHLHGTVDVESLFPRGNGSNGTKTVEIRSRS